MGRSHSKDEEIVDSSSDSESDYDSESDDDSEEIVTKGSVLSQLQLAFGPTVAWGWNNLGTFGWFASTTFLVMVMPLIFEVEREQMMTEMMQQQKAQQQSQASGSTIKMPAPGSLPSV
jgi:hypothetical protein|tara:strand:- start:160 stop:513 length:354 start_codon:yes stop_codon:yes gene_type:complete